MMLFNNSSTITKRKPLTGGELKLRETKAQYKHKNIEAYGTLILRACLGLSVLAGIYTAKEYKLLEIIFDYLARL
jgi:hypothetical protein